MINLKLALRTLRRAPFVTSVAMVSLALGIGGNAAIFSLFNQVLLRALPVPDQDRLVNLSAPGPKPGGSSCNTAGDCEDVFSYPMFRDLERVQTAFTGIAAHRTFDANLAYDGQTVNGEGMLVSGSYFPTLGIQPVIGRLIGPADDAAPGEAHVIVLSHAYWQTRFGGDANIVNRAMIVNGQTMTIVGVAPRGFQGTTLGREPKAFVPLTMRALMQPGWNQFENRRHYSIYLFARLNPGVTIDSARAALNTQYRAIVNDVEAPLQQGISEQMLTRFKAKPIVVEPGRRGQSLVPSLSGPALTLLLGASVFVLLIACANIANLLLARAAAREGEMAIRLSIGASRRHLVVQLLVESGLLALGGGVAGLFVAQWTLDLIGSLLPALAVTSFNWRVDPPLVVFAAAVTFGTVLLFGLFPAIYATRPNVASALKRQAGQPSGSRTAKRFRTSLATAQMALSMALLAAAGLFAKSLTKISHVDLGAKVDRVITFQIAPTLNGYTSERTRQLFQRLEDDLAALPEVAAVTNSLNPLIAGDNWGNDVSVEGYAAGPDTDMGSRYNEIGSDYFQTLGIPLLAGREFVRTDSTDSPKVAIVNQAFARKFNLGRDAVGKHLGNRRGPLDTEIVGLVQDAKYSEVKQTIPPVFYRPYRQGGPGNIGSIYYYVRTSLNPEQFLATVPRIVARLDPNLPVTDLRTMPQQVRENVFLDRFIGILAATFAGLATLLAAVGLYGVLAYSVAQRTREIGLRMALGAAPSRVRAMILRQVAAMAAMGGTIGLVGAVGIGRLAESMLYQLKGSDPTVLVGAALALAGVALAAGFVPAYRASQVDPMTALRYE
jgi:predicted permease